MQIIRAATIALLWLACAGHVYGQFGFYPTPAPSPIPPVLAGGAATAYPQSTRSHGSAAPSMTSPNPYYGHLADPVAPPAWETAGAPAHVPHGRVEGPFQPPPAFHSPSDQPTLPPPTAIPPPGSPLGDGPIRQMLREPGHSGYPVWTSHGDYSQTPCSEISMLAAPRCPKWFASVAALYMSRNEPNRLLTTYEAGNNTNNLTTDATPSWGVGGEITFGRTFGLDACQSTCDPCGSGGFGRDAFSVEATYWGLEIPNGQSVRSIPGGMVSTPLIVSDIKFDGINGTSYFDGAAVHFVRRQNEIHNLELNFVRSPLFPSGYRSGSLTLGWGAGARYFRFEENLLFGSLDAGYSWGADGGIHEAYLEDNVRNHLIGGQIGFDLDYCLSPNWRLFAAPKLGIYNNHAEHYFTLRRGDGLLAVPTEASGMGGEYPVRSSQDGVAFLSEIDLGIDWQVASHWSLYVGYRAVIASGIALADHQVPTYVVDLPEIADINTNGNLVLHGAFVGSTLRF